MFGLDLMVFALVRSETSMLPLPPPSIMTFAYGFSLPVAPSLKGKGEHCGGGGLMRHPSHVLVSPWPLGTKDPMSHSSPLNL